jgi:hypothetical protein
VKVIPREAIALAPTPVTPFRSILLVPDPKLTTDVADVNEKEAVVPNEESTAIVKF